MSAPGLPGPEPDWAARPAGGWNEFRAARARFLATLAEQSALARLERAWTLPARGSPQGGRREQEPDPGRLRDVRNPPWEDPTP